MLEQGSLSLGKNQGQEGLDLNLEQIQVVFSKSLFQLEAAGILGSK